MFPFGGPDLPQKITARFCGDPKPARSRYCASPEASIPLNPLNLLNPLNPLNPQFSILNPQFTLGRHGKKQVQLTFFLTD